MDWDHIVEELKEILQIPLKREVMSADDWDRLASRRQTQEDILRRGGKNGRVYIALGTPKPDLVEVLELEEALVTPSELRLVEMLLEAWAGKAHLRSEEPVQLVNEDERKALLVREWLLDRLESGDFRADMPEPLATQLSLYTPRIPFLVNGDYTGMRKVSYVELKRLLESFFDEEILLIPLMEKEWLILGSEGLLTASQEEDREGGEEETQEEALFSLCSGLYEMLSNEWVGECHVTTNYPKTPAASLLSSVQEMREAIRLGKKYHVGSNLHLPWTMHMERLLYAVPDQDRMQFVDHILRGIDHVLDQEMLSTLENFFALDCNVSETAKKLYIHRNTLLYRLDKFKQETGKDVRTFNDAVLVKTALLLYKVTKRK
ncbi:CdaR family transcriptional regulator [Paenibacillus sp. YN15]|uniref:PucR family transcriptional regulator n=1 Tax=Paenibacillus sp. YN15 TaxID=1742774 RepID=UPI000DCDF4D1|nr:helix-turn-helix domain-containing protein [Paenibacillus sp. YN15]RAU90956.1 PucR family transcriptional regulator [Paenibacillus sp. YN15]